MIMTKYILKPITDLSWVLLANGDRTALISQNDRGITAIGNIVTKHYKDLDDLKLQLGDDVTIELPAAIAAEPESGYINGFPIKHTTWYDTLIDPVPSYTRTANSTIRYSAGYYALKFAHGWTAAFCPKLSTYMLVLMVLVVASR